MTDLRRELEPAPADQLAYAPRFGIELMNLCDHAAVAAGIELPATQAMADEANGGDLCVRCPRCSRAVDVRCWRPESGDWYLRLRDRFAAGQMSIFRYSGGVWVTDG